MTAWWIISLLVVFILISTVNSRFDLDTPVRIARCRATCLYKMEAEPNTDRKCKTSLFCSQCWKSCGVLQTLTTGKLLCGSKDCGRGCPEACRFHSLPVSLVSPVPLEEALVVNDSRVSWPAVPGPVVYVVMVDGSSLCQTLEPSITLPSEVDLATVRVLVVDWRGLVKVFGPGAESPVDRALHILRSLGMEDNLAPPMMPVSDNDVTHLENSVHQIQVDSSWRVTLLSLHHQPSLVLVEIGWETYHNHLLRNIHVNLSYLVSWAAEGDVVRGNLLTNTSTATLSLWPNTTYSVQVALFSLEAPAIQSEPMTLDTHQVSESTINTTSHPVTARLPEPQTHTMDGRPDGDTTDSHERLRFGGAPGREVAAGVSAAVLVFLGVVLAATWRWRNRLYLPHNKLLDEESNAPNLYRVFPPALRLLGDSDRSSDMFSSRDSLLQQP